MSESGRVGARVVSCELFAVNIPYRAPEVSSVVYRRGVSALLIKLTDASGRIGWGEACAGASLESVRQALLSMEPFVVGRLPRDRRQIRQEVYHRGLWSYQQTTGNYAWAGYDMALTDLQAQQEEKPFYAVLGDLQRYTVEHFYYLSRGSDEWLQSQGDEILSSGYSIAYLKVGIDRGDEYRMLSVLRSQLGPGVRIRIDANGAWTVGEATEILREWDDEFQIDLCEQPTPEYPLSLMQQVRSLSGVRIAANEGMAPYSNARTLIEQKVADVYTFSPYWVGDAGDFLELSTFAADAGGRTCRHTHGETGVASTAFHHLALVTPGLDDGNQQTSRELEFDVLESDIPLRSSPTWGVPDVVGLGLRVSEDALRHAAEHYSLNGQFLPYDPEGLP